VVFALGGSMDGMSWEIYPATPDRFEDFADVINLALEGRAIRRRPSQWPSWSACSRSSTTWIPPPQADNRHLRAPSSLVMRSGHSLAREFHVEGPI
jgi:hypothetical protein